MVELRYAGSTSACFELKNDLAYYAPKPYRVLLDGEERLKGDTNVFSLFGLTPDHEYTLTTECGDDISRLTFRTAKETCAIDARAAGAVGDGVADDTAALQMAIRLLPQGGRLHVPSGVFRTGPLFLKSHMTLELSEGAVLLGLTEKTAYPVIPGAIPSLDGGEAETGAFEGLTRSMYASLLTGEYLTDVTVVGPGLLDGNAQNGDWWTTFKQDPVARPRLLFLNRCQDVVVHGLQAANSASWQLHPYWSQRVAFLDVAVTAPKISPNTDALDPESCDKVDIIGCRFSVGDDCIAIKSGKLDPARPHKAAASRHTIRNCLMAFGHGAVTLGSEISGGVNRLSVTQCLFKQTDRGLRIKTRRGRGKGCDIDGVSFDNIVMDGVLTPIVINMWYNCVDPDGNSDYVQGRDPLPVDERTPHLGRFTFKNMVCTGTEVAACYVDGLPEMPVDSVTLQNIRVSYAENAREGVPAMMTNAQKRRKLGLYFDNVKNVTLRNVTIEGCEGDALTARHVGRVMGREKSE